MRTKKSLSIANSWLQILSKALNTHLLFDKENLCSFHIGKEHIVIEVSQNFPVVHIYCQLFALSGYDFELQIALMKKALEINAFYNIVREGTIGASPDCEFLIYRHSIPIDGTYADDFCRMLDKILETLPLIRNILGLLPDVESSDNS